MTTFKVEKLMPFIEKALYEDIGEIDHTTNALIDKKMSGKGYLLVKDNGIIAGVELAKTLLKYFDKQLNIKVLYIDGSDVRAGDVVLEVEGCYLSMLTTERVLLNCMQRMSGIATTTNILVQKIAHTNAKILDTRKTTPLCRDIEKWAVVIGGGYNHRFGLYDEILVKNNHIDACGGIESALDRLAAYHRQNSDIKIVLECRNDVEWMTALEKAPYIDRLLLDNMTPDIIKRVVDYVNGRVVLEASGNIGDENIVDYAETGVDYISIGMLTHSITSLDMSLRVSLD